MRPASHPLLRPRAADSRIERLRVRLDDGSRSTLHVASYELRAFRPRIVALERPLPLAQWCAAQEIRHAIVGGFFKRPEYVPLGELRSGGAALEHAPFDQPWAAVRACVQIGADGIRIARRDRLGPRPHGDLLQAGPLLVAGGRKAVSEGSDPEGFSAGAHQFDSDITRGRYPRTALALAGARLLAVACDGRTRRDAGMTLPELAEALVALGVSDALNLDGGGSASLIYGGRLRNRPREEHGVDILGGRPIVTAIVFEPR